MKLDQHLITCESTKHPFEDDEIKSRNQSQVSISFITLFVVDNIITSHQFVLLIRLESLQRG